MTNVMKSRLEEIGLDGLAMLLLSNLLIVATFGISELLVILHVLKTALTAPTRVAGLRWLIVPGVKLENNQPGEEFCTRLDRVRAMYDDMLHKKIILLGGVVGENTISEAAAGKRYLVNSGIPAARMVLEQHSAHTLDNFRFARLEMQKYKQRNVLIISSRYHLARCAAMASALKIKFDLCGAEDDFSWSPENLFRIVREAYFLHWYWCGRYWAKLTNNKSMLRRLS